MDRMTERTEKKKAAIRAAAATLLTRYPPDKISVRDIAAEAGVSVVTIYNHFQSKEGLLHEVVLELVRKKAEVFRTVAESGASFPEKIEMLVLESTQAFADIPPGFLDVVVADQRLMETLNQIYQQPMMDWFMQIIAQGKREGYVDPSLPDTLIISVIQLFNRDLASPDSILLARHQVSEIHRQIFDILMYGIAGKHSKDREHGTRHGNTGIASQKTKKC